MKIVSILVVIVIPAFLLSCDKAIEASTDIAHSYGMSDKYPEIKAGFYQIKGQALTSTVFLPGDDEPIPMLFMLDNGYKLLAEAQRFGNHSITLKPKRLVCGENDIHIEDQLSIAYLNARINGIQPQFEVYVERLKDCSDEQ